MTKDAVYGLVMPGKALTLHANFNADPNSSRVSIKASPEEGGSVRPSGAARYQKGSTISLTASANSGFKFLRWDDSDGNTVATTSSYTYTVPDHDIELTAVFEYDPASRAIRNRLRM